MNDTTPDVPSERNCKSLIAKLIDFGAGSGYSQVEFACAVTALNQAILTGALGDDAQAASTAMVRALSRGES